MLNIILISLLAIANISLFGKITNAAKDINAYNNKNNK